MYLLALGLSSAIFCQDKRMIKVLNVELLFFSEDARLHLGSVSRVRSITSRVHKIHFTVHDIKAVILCADRYETIIGLLFYKCVQHRPF
jgi:hypothetical protein